MNERIEALKKLATKEVWSENQYNGSPEFDGYELDADMFAELIVKECVSVINTEAAEHEDDDEIERAWKMGTEFAVYQIKKHFGVEE